MSPDEANSASFPSSLPAEYRERFGPAQVALHAHTSRSRNGAPIAAALFPWSDQRLSALCVIADDRPGLLSLVSAALTQSGFDVDAAEAYTRSDSGEAVDIFWLRSPSGSISAEKVRSFVALAGEMLLGRSGATIPPPAPGVVSAASHGSGRGTTVRFHEDKSGALTVLELETDDRSGLLWAITRALYCQKVQIVGSKIRTEGGRVFDRFTLVELDGSPIRSARRLTIQVEILSAIGG